MKRAGVRIAVALGSNLGDRQAHLDRAVEQLHSCTSHLTRSRSYETDPVGVAPQPRFLNAAITGETTLAPRALLERLLAIEAGEGRVRPYAGAPRTLDLDLILYGDRVIDEPGLAVPHPRFRVRRFVLDPLAEIAGEWVDPVTGLTLEQLRQRLDRRP